MSSPAERGSSQEPSGYLRLVVVMAAVYSLLFVMAQMHRMGGAVIAPYLSEELRLSASDLGLVIGAMFFASAAAQPLSGVLLDRFGSVRAVTLLMPVAVGGMLLFAWTDSVASLTVGRILIGAGFSCVVSGLYVFLLGWVRRENFTVAATLILAVPGTAAVLLSSTPLAVSLDEFGRGPVFTGLAVATVLVVTLVAFTVREGPRSNRHTREPETLRQSFAGTLTILRQRRFLWIAAYGLTSLGPAYSVIGLLSGVYLRERFALDTAALGNAVFALLIALNLGGAIYGPIDRLLGRRKLVIVSGVSIQVTLMCVLAAVGGLNFWMTLGLLVAFAAVSQIQPLVLAHAQSLFGPEFSGRVITTTNIFMVGGIFVFQGAAGLAYDVFTQTFGADPIEGYRLTFLALGLCQIIGVLFYLQAPAPMVETARGSGR